MLVGHSWAGAVITQVGTDPKVAGLVFAAAGAPNAGESFSEMSQGYPTPPGIAILKPDAAGFLALPPSCSRLGLRARLTIQRYRRNGGNARPDRGCLL